MGTRGHRENKLIAFDHLSTGLYIHKTNNCKFCPLKLYAKENDKVILGIGNLYSNIMMVLPNYNTNAKISYITILSLLKDKYKEIIGTDLFEDCYVTRFVKCYNVSQFDITYSSWFRCYHYLCYEIDKLKPEKIILFDNKFEDFIKCYTDNKGINVYSVMNPAVLYYDNEKLKEKFVEQLKEVL